MSKREQITSSVGYKTRLKARGCYTEWENSGMV